VSDDLQRDDSTGKLEGHGGELAVAAAQAYGVQAMFTLSGAHVFPLYDGAVKTGLPLIDVRHEQTAVFAAEGLAKLTRSPGLAVVTAGPGVTNAISAVTTAHANGSPLLVMGGRAPHFRWGTGALQEMDHPPLLTTVTKRAATVNGPEQIAHDVDDALNLATGAHRGPVFLDVAMDHLFSRAEVERPAGPQAASREPDGDDLDRVAAALRTAQRPLLVLGSDVWADGAEQAARELVEALDLPAVTNGMGRGILGPAHPNLVTRARSRAFGNADLVVVIGTPLDFRLGYGQFGGKDGGVPAKVVHLADSEGQLATHVQLEASAAGDLSAVLNGLRERLDPTGVAADVPTWRAELRSAHQAAVADDHDLLHSTHENIHPARVYGELLQQLDDDAVVIGDGGDFVSFAGRFVEPGRPGRWMDPGPFGCLGTGLGYAVAARIAHPESQVVLLLGDGAAGFSLMDVDTLVRHKLPVVMIVGNNGIWGLEKFPMQFLYGYDVAAELTPGTRYDEVVKSLGGDGELVTRPEELAGALRRAFASPVPYCVNVLTDPGVAYPRSTTGV
jgi:thiamine pyrophosphate-dependent acetolactate synthase large subunit-like protein